MFKRGQKTFLREIENSKNAFSLETGSTSGIDSRPHRGALQDQVHQFDIKLRYLYLDITLTLKRSEK